jgi:hypothetical protein
VITNEIPTVTGRKVVELELRKTLDRLRELATISENPELLALIPTLEDGLDRLTKNKCGNAKVFVAVYSNREIDVEATVPLDVIVAFPDRCNTEMLKTMTLSPLPEQAFLEHIHDELAEALQSGLIEPATINQAINTYGPSKKS